VIDQRLPFRVKGGALPSRAVDLHSGVEVEAEAEVEVEIEVEVFSVVETGKEAEAKARDATTIEIIGDMTGEAKVLGKVKITRGRQMPEFVPPVPPDYADGGSRRASVRAASRSRGRDGCIETG